MVYGYSRISTQRQSIERQIRNIKAAYPDAIIVEEAYSGMTVDRPKWQQLFSMAKKGDTIVFDSVSRMSRDAESGFKSYQELYKRGVGLVFLKEPHINTEVYRNALNASVSLTGTNVDCILQGINEFLLRLAQEQIQLAFQQAEKEVNDLHQRTREGIVTAKLAGKRIGQARGSKLTTKKSIEAKEGIIKYSAEFNGSLSDKDVIRLIGISRNTYYKYKRELHAKGK